MPPLWILIFSLALLWSGLAPADRLTWWLETLPALLAFAAIWLSRRAFPLTPLVLWLALVHCLLLMVGAHYTYAEVPLFDWIADGSATAATILTSSAILPRALYRHWWHGRSSCDGSWSTDAAGAAFLYSASVWRSVPSMN